MSKLIAVLIALAFLTPLHAKVHVAATIPDYAALAAELGGERVEATALIKGAQDPHFADALPSHVVRLNRADLLVLTGCGLEAGWLPPLMTQSRNDTVQPGSAGYLDASTVVTLKEVPTTVDKSQGDVHPGGNPHFYTGPAELYAVAAAIYDRLKKIDPEGAVYYDGRWRDFRATYERKTAEWRAKLAPLKGTKVVEYHKSWLYFLDWAGLVGVGALEPKPGIPPSVRHVTDLLAAVQGKEVRFVIQEIYHPQKLSRLFAEKSGAKLLVIPSMTGALPGIDTVWEKFDHIVNELTRP